MDNLFVIRVNCIKFFNPNLASNSGDFGSNCK